MSVACVSQSSPTSARAIGGSAAVGFELLSSDRLERSPVFTVCCPIQSTINIDTAYMRWACAYACLPDTTASTPSDQHSYILMSSNHKLVLMNLLDCMMNRRMCVSVPVRIGLVCMSLAGTCCVMLVMMMAMIVVVLVVVPMRVHSLDSFSFSAHDHHRQFPTSECPIVG